jgi:hypothetical protein
LDDVRLVEVGCSESLPKLQSAARGVQNGWLVERWCARFPTHPFRPSHSPLRSPTLHYNRRCRMCGGATHIAHVYVIGRLLFPLPTFQHRALTTGAAAAAISSRDHTARRLCPLLHCATGVVVSVRPGVHHALLWPAVARALSVSSSSPSPANGSATAIGKKSGKPGGAKGDSGTTSTSDNGGVGTARPPVASRVVGPKAVVAPATVTSTLLATAGRAGDAAAAAKVTNSGGNGGVRGAGGSKPHASKAPVVPGKSGSGGGGVAGVAAAPAASKKKPGRYTQLSRGLLLTFVHWRPHLSPSPAPCSYHLGATLTKQAPSTYRIQPL